MQQDINDLKGGFNYEVYGLSKEQAQRQAKGIISNLEDHLEELLGESIN